MRRLEELLRQMCCAAKAIGNSELEAKFTEGRFNPIDRMSNRSFVLGFRYTKNQTRYCFRSFALFINIMINISLLFCQFVK